MKEHLALFPLESSISHMHHHSSFLTHKLRNHHHSREIESHEMATKQSSFVHVDEEDCIDIELNSCSPNLFSYSIIDTPPHNIEFEFQNKKESTTSPADELFYKGTLLPLHLPPRLEMVEKLLENTDATFGFARSHSSLEDSRFRYITNATTPLESCNISPSESCRVSSCESLPPEFQFHWSSEIEGLVSDHNVPKKLHCSKNVKQFWLAQRFKASRDYLKSLFSKSGCSHKSSASDAANKVGAVKKQKCKECCDDDARKNKNKNKNNTFEFFCENKHRKQRSCAVKNNYMLEDSFTSSSRRSFAGAIQRNYACKASSLSASSSGSSSSSSSFSLSSAGSYELHLFSKNLNNELENSIEGAIAYCKKSQQEGSSNKVCSQSAVCGNKDKMKKILVEQNELVI